MIGLLQSADEQTNFTAITFFYIGRQSSMARIDATMISLQTIGSFPLPEGSGQAVANEGNLELHMLV
jgi:hypothetical protein